VLLSPGLTYAKHHPQQQFQEPSGQDAGLQFSQDDDEDADEMAPKKRAFTNPFSRSYFKQAGEKVKQRWRDHRKKRGEAFIDRLAWTLYRERNREAYGEVWDLANRLGNCASKLIEKRYGGSEAVLAGAEYLHELSIHWQDPGYLAPIAEECEATYLNFRHEKRIMEVEESERQNLRVQLEDIFASSPMAVPMLTDTFNTPLLRCIPRGGNGAAAWFVGASVGLYRLKCKSPLGRRMFYGKGNLAGIVGYGAEISGFTPRYDRKGDRTEEHYVLIPMHGKGYRPSLVLTGGAALAGGAAGYYEMTKGGGRDTTHARKEYGAGLAGYAGGGLGNLIKIKDIDPDFRELFAALGLGFQ